MISLWRLTSCVSVQCTVYLHVSVYSVQCTNMCQCTYMCSTTYVEFKLAMLLICYFKSIYRPNTIQNCSMKIPLNLLLSVVSSPQSELSSILWQPLQPWPALLFPETWGLVGSLLLFWKWPGLSGGPGQVGRQRTLPLSLSDSGPLWDQPRDTRDFLNMLCIIYILKHGSNGSSTSSLSTIILGQFKYAGEDIFVSN